MVIRAAENHGASILCLFIFFKELFFLQGALRPGKNPNLLTYKNLCVTGFAPYSCEVASSFVVFILKLKKTEWSSSTKVLSVDFSYNFKTIELGILESKYLVSTHIDSDHYRNKSEKNIQ